MNSGPAAASGRSVEIGAVTPADDWLNSDTSVSLLAFLHHEIVTKSLMGTQEFIPSPLRTWQTLQHFFPFTWSNAYWTMRPVTMIQFLWKRVTVLTINHNLLRIIFNLPVHFPPKIWHLVIILTTEIEHFVRTPSFFIPKCFCCGFLEELALEQRWKLSEVCWEPDLLQKFTQKATWRGLEYKVGNNLFISLDEFM